MMVLIGCLSAMTFAACDSAPAGPSESPVSGSPVGSAGVNLGSPAVHVSATGQLMFTPAKATVQVGQIVEWTNTGSVVHTVTFTSYPYLSDPTLAPAGTWEVKFNKAGTYAYQCTIHAGMTGTLVVTGG